MSTTAQSLADRVARDASYVPSERPSAAEQLSRSLLCDARDWPFLLLIGQMTLLLLPFAIALFALRTFPWWLGVLYLALVFNVFSDRFILMLHNTSHRPLFKRRYALLNHYIPWVLGPLIGETPETYYAHHIGMHHPENNLEADLSTTMAYQRDRFTHFLHYWATFMLLGNIGITRYFLKNKRYKLLRRFWIGELSWYLAVALGCWWSVQATIFVLIVPVLMVRTLMMIGNWGQHAFIAPEAPECCYRNSITCIDSRYNRRCFNDGYHIIHHIKQTMHWTDLPSELARNEAEYAKHDALVFADTDFFGVWLLLMTGRHHTLARHLVHLAGTPARSEEELVALLRHRLQPIVRSAA